VVCATSAPTTSTPVSSTTITTTTTAAPTTSTPVSSTGTIVVGVSISLVVVLLLCGGWYKFNQKKSANPAESYTAIQ
jgi:hypothetical protein